jgi:hypothetical protein
VCLSDTLRLETYIQDAEREGDTELATIFRKAEAESRKGAGQGKQLLRQRQLTGPLAWRPARRAQSGPSRRGNAGAMTQSRISDTDWPEGGRDGGHPPEQPI